MHNTGSWPEAAVHSRLILSATNKLHRSGVMSRLSSHDCECTVSGSILPDAHIAPKTLLCLLKATCVCHMKQTYLPNQMLAAAGAGLHCSTQLKRLWVKLIVAKDKWGSWADGGTGGHHSNLGAPKACGINELLSDTSLQRGKTPGLVTFPETGVLEASRRDSDEGAVVGECDCFSPMTPMTSATFLLPKPPDSSLQ